MLKAQIGEHAGRIWQCLSEKQEMQISALKKATHLNDKELYLALGWLAREEKIMFFEKDEKIYVCLVY